ncbi:serine hydrolase [Naasia sp. SYSU D00948]|uniref:serine hydrolase domain-containing protein n=1 Tax=Naasia sp. SYSU D00948 TaxID=2817379 RepID=UPI001B30B556|nr:serine hydrolase domain-containing protein [Naasia sp. SYSU D00948]
MLDGTAMRAKRARARAVADALVLAVTLAGCAAGGAAGSGSSKPPQPGDVGYGYPPADAVASVTPERVRKAVRELPDSVEELMEQTGVPGVAVAVVYDGETIYAEGFGVRSVEGDEPVDADTVFQLASVSKSLGATVVARQVAEGVVTWDTPVIELLPEFALSDPWVTEHLTIADLYAHRSGLWEHAGDDLEDLGYDRATILERLRQLPLAPFRSTYAYGNFDITTGAEAVARAAGEDWADLSQRVLYEPLGMESTSSRFDDYMAQENRVDGHILDGTEWVVTPLPRDADPESPAGGVSSSAADMAAWLTALLALSGPDAPEGGLRDALLPAIAAQIVSAPGGAAYARSGFYGYGFNVSVTAGGLANVSHSGAFYLGTGTNFSVLPARASASWSSPTRPRTALRRRSPRSSSTARSSGSCARTGSRSTARPSPPAPCRWESWWGRRPRATRFRPGRSPSMPAATGTATSGMLS